MFENLKQEENEYFLKLAIERDSKEQTYTSKEDFFKECEIDEEMLDNLPKLEME